MTRRGTSPEAPSGERTDDADLVVLDMTALKALAHPLRVAIVSTLAAYGPATASALAERLGESSGATSYHVRQLEKHGFVREVPGRGTGRERWWERTPTMIGIDAARPERDTGERIARDLVVGEFQRARQARLEAFMARGLEVLEPEWIAVSDVATVNMQLTPEQAGELLAELTEVRERYRAKYRTQDGADVRPVQLHIDLFPLVDGLDRPGGVGGPRKD